MGMKHSLRSQLIFQYMVIVIVCMLVIPTAISNLLEWQFRNFLNERLDEYESEFLEYLANAYVENGSWRVRGALPRGSNFIRWPVAMVEITDERGVVVGIYRRYGQQPPGPRPMPMTRGRHHDRGAMQPQPQPRPQAPNMKEITVTHRDIVVGGTKVGKVSFYVMPFDKSPENKFLKQFNKIMYYAVAVMLLISAGIAIFMAYRIGTPVLIAARRAQQISTGKYVDDGEERPVESNITELQTLVESVDRLGRSLEEQEQLRKRLMSDIAHELRNPVAVIKSHLEAIEDGVWEASPERIRLTVSEVDRLSQLIREVEKLTTIEGAAHSISLEELDVSSIVEKAALVFDPLYKNKGVELKREIEPEVMTVVDGAKIRQVAENLLSNALRYTDAGGTVSVSLASGEKDITISVADTGIGIAAKDLPYIFERFYRTDVSRARTSGGIGIGLAIVKAIVEAHGGTIEVESEPGKGSRFIVKIPRKVI